MRELFPQAVRSDTVDCGHAECGEGAILRLRDASSGLSVAVWARDIRIGLLAGRALPDAEGLFGLVQQLARSITKRIGWIAYDPAQRVTLRPTDRFRDRAIGLIRGWTEAPDGRWSWNVV